jgi:signal transduction histidine kinase
LEFQLDSSIGNVKVIHQDLGRVLINIVNNSCQALEEKIAANPDFEAKIMVKSHNLERSFQCIVEDNGKGMSEELQHKIFNPFFTTKPTGKGTGLGLTMTYDIVTKMHQGSIHVESEEGKYSRFIIEIPKNLNPN